MSIRLGTKGIQRECREAGIRKVCELHFVFKVRLWCTEYCKLWESGCCEDRAQIVSCTHIEGNRSLSWEWQVGNQGWKRGTLAVASLWLGEAAIQGFEQFHMGYGTGHSCALFIKYQAIWISSPYVWDIFFAFSLIKVCSTSIDSNFFPNYAVVSGDCQFLLAETVYSKIFVWDFRSSILLKGPFTA